MRVALFALLLGCDAREGGGACRFRFGAPTDRGCTLLSLRPVASWCCPPDGGAR
jgi:hypothetical protein